MVAKRFLEAIPLLQSSSPSKVAESLMSLNELVQTFPEGLINMDVSSPLCPLKIVLFSHVFPHNLLDSMIGILPKHESFSLRSDCWLPLDDWFQQQRRTSLDNARSMRAIRAIVENVEEFILRRSEFTKAEATKVLAMLFRSTNAAERVHIDADVIQEDGSVEEILGPAKKILERIGGGSHITGFSIAYNGIALGPTMSIQNLLFQMANLTRLDVYVSEPWKSTKELCKSLCDLLKQGRLQRLEVIGATTEAGLFLPLLDAADRSETLTELRLQDLKNQAEVEIYHDKMLRILDHNTHLKAALICEDNLTTNNIFEDGDESMTKQTNKQCFLDRTKGNNKQRVIDYHTLLNVCGRGRAKAEGTQLKNFVRMISAEKIWERIHFLDFTVLARWDLVTILQYGLLRQQPATWLVNERKPSTIKNSSRATRARNVQGTRKRKATGHPVESSLA
eukprot:Sro2571_g331570.2  (450) ;mRNA; f:3717-5066